MVEIGEGPQASKKIWDSVAYTLRRIAETHGWPRQSNSHLARIASYLAAATGDEAINGEYMQARSFLADFHEEWYGLGSIRGGVSTAKRLVERLLEADRKVKDGALPPNGAKTPREYELLQEAAMPINIYIAALRRQGLSCREAEAAARLLLSAQSRRVPIEDMSFRIGSLQRRITLGEDGLPKVGKPKAPRGNTNAG